MLCRNPGNFGKDTKPAPAQMREKINHVVHIEAEVGVSYEGILLFKEPKAFDQTSTRRVLAISACLVTGYEMRGWFQFIEILRNFHSIDGMEEFGAA